MDNWIDNSVVIDFKVPKSIENFMKECDELNEMNDYSYFNYVELLDHMCKEACYLKYITKKQWETIERKYLSYD